jgi:hypothetical protein
VHSQVDPIRAAMGMKSWVGKASRDFAGVPAADANTSP